MKERSGNAEKSTGEKETTVIKDQQTFLSGREKYRSGEKKVSACPETEADNRRTGWGIIAINVSEMYLCAFYSGHKSWTKHTDT